MDARKACKHIWEAYYKPHLDKCKVLGFVSDAEMKKHGLALRAKTKLKEKAYQRDHGGLNKRLTTGTAVEIFANKVLVGEDKSDKTSGDTKKYAGADLKDITGENIGVKGITYPSQNHNPTVHVIFESSKDDAQILGVSERIKGGYRCGLFGFVLGKDLKKTCDRTHIIDKRMGKIAVTEKTMKKIVWIRTKSDIKRCIRLVRDRRKPKSV